MQPRDWEPLRDWVPAPDYATTGDGIDLATGQRFKVGGLLPEPPPGTPRHSCGCVIDAFSPRSADGGITIIPVRHMGEPPPAPGFLMACDARAGQWVWANGPLPPPLPGRGFPCRID